MSQARYIWEPKTIPTYATVLNNPKIREILLTTLRAGNESQRDLAKRLELVIELKEDLKHDAAFCLGKRGKTPPCCESGSWGALRFSARGKILHVSQWIHVRFFPALKIEYHPNLHFLATGRFCLASLAYEGEVDLRGAEDRKPIERSLTIAHEDPSALSNPEFIETAEKRDSFAVEQAFNNPGRNHIFIFGQFHNFKANVESHNQQNPDKQIYLIKITPSGLDEFVSSL